MTKHINIRKIAVSSAQSCSKAATSRRARHPRERNPLIDDYFTQEADIDLGRAADPWRIAEDIRNLFEILFGDNWKRTNVEFEATSESHITFRATDLTSLQQQVSEFGGPMRDISIDATLWKNGESRSCDSMIWFQNETTKGVLLNWYMPLRVDTEAFRYGIERVVKDFRRRKRWSEATIKVRDITHQSEAEPSTKAKGPQLVTVRGVKWGWRRWFVSNRDNIIISLFGGLLVSVSIIILQLIDLVPVPT